MKKKTFTVTSIAVSLLFFAGGIYAGTTVPDMVKMENKAYKDHKKSIVTFSHKKHTEAYKTSCGDCHHDDKGKPLTNLKAGDKVQGCIECHKIAGERPKGKGAPKLTKKERLQYHAEAIHYNCKDCHKKYNKDKGLKSKDNGAAPTLCKQCHPKKSGESDADEE